MTDNGSTGRRLVDRLAIGILIGIVAVSVGGVALLTVYLNRIGDAAQDLSRTDALGAYEGRPSPVVIDGVNALNYLLMTTDEHGRLDAVLIAHLSASRRQLTLVALPSDLLAEDGTGRRTLALSFGADPLRAARAVEGLTGARMDHQVQLGLHGFADVVDVLGGVDLGGARLSGADVLARLHGEGDPLRRSVLTADLLRASLSRANLGVAITDPTRFDRVMDALTPCLTVDAELTGDGIRSTLVESRVRVDQVQAWPLAASRDWAGAEPHPGALAELRSALATDAFPRPPAPSAIASPVHTPQTAVAGTASAWASAPSALTTPEGSPVASTPSGPRADAGPSPAATR